jgi:phosphate transport system substrate-binding protein
MAVRPAAEQGGRASGAARTISEGQTMRYIAGAFVAAGLGLAAGPGLAADISGAGASFPAPVYQKWAEAYHAETGNAVNYQSIGSGAGIKQITARTVTFGASDAPLDAEKLAESGLVQWPQIMGGVVPAIHLPGVEPGKLVLSGKVLGEIYLGNITAWNDPQIKELNPRLDLPDLAIAPVYRSDGSGTTFLFTSYLTKVDEAFGSEVGAATAVQWPVGIGAKGNEGVANMVNQTRGAIGYVEYAYIKQNEMNYAALLNAAGETVQPTAEAFQAAAASADWTQAPGFYLILIDQPGEQAWPITGASFILMPANPSDREAAVQALDFFAWAFEKGDEMALELDYVPMPDAVVSAVETVWKEKITAGGEPIWTAAN